MGKGKDQVVRIIHLNGLEAAIDKAFGITIRPDGCSKNNPTKIHLVRYADEFVVTANDKDILENRVKPIIEEFLSERGASIIARENQNYPYHRRIRLFSDRFTCFHEYWQQKMEVLR